MRCGGYRRKRLSLAKTITAKVDAKLETPERTIDVSVISEQAALEILNARDAFKRRAENA